MNFKEARSALIEALREGRFQHEAREAQEEKNFVAVGDLTAEQVIEILKACVGRHYKWEWHHVLPRVEVHVFKGKKIIGSWKQWFIRAYFLEEDAWFIRRSSR